MNSTAYVKMLLHAAKYPHCSVNGVFLKKKLHKKEDESGTQIKNAIPLFHVNVTLLPMLELALTQVSFWLWSFDNWFWICVVVDLSFCLIRSRARLLFSSLLLLWVLFIYYKTTKAGKILMKSWVSPSWVAGDKKNFCQ